MEITTKEFMNIESIVTSCSEEKETLININSEGVSVYTTDSKYLHKLQKLILDCNSLVTTINITKNRDGEVTSVDCDMNDDNFMVTISKKRQLSEETLEKLRKNAFKMKGVKAN